MFVYSFWRTWERLFTSRSNGKCTIYGYRHDQLYKWRFYWLWQWLPLCRYWGIFLWEPGVFQHIQMNWRLTNAAAPEKISTSYLELSSAILFWNFYTFVIWFGYVLDELSSIPAYLITGLVVSTSFFFVCVFISCFYSILILFYIVVMSLFFFKLMVFDL